MIPPKISLDENSITKMSITKLLKVNEKSLISKYCFEKSENLQVKRVENNNVTTLLMIEDAVHL